MTWNYRIVEHKVKGEKEAGYFAIHEAYYEPDAPADSITNNPITPIADDPDELIRVLEMMLADAKKSRLAILDYDAF